MRILTIDLETYYSSEEYSLSKMPATDYIYDPRFEILMLGVSESTFNVASDGSITALPRSSSPSPSAVNVYTFPPPSGYGISGELLYNILMPSARGETPKRFASSSLTEPTLLVAHNGAGFDFLALYAGAQYGRERVLSTLDQPVFFVDTIHLMRWTGVARVTGESLSCLTDYFNTGKKRAGTIVSDNKRLVDFNEEELADFTAYCGEDVQQTRDCFIKMAPYMTEDALLFSHISTEMGLSTDFIIDETVLFDYIEALTKEEDEARQQLSDLLLEVSPDLCTQSSHTHGYLSSDDMMSYVKSTDKFAELLEHLGVEIPMKASAKATYTYRKQLERYLNRLRDEERRRKTGSDTPCADAGASDTGTTHEDSHTDVNTSTATSLAAVQAEIRRVEAVLSDPEKMTQYAPALSKTDDEFLSLMDHPDMRVRLLVDMRLQHNSSIAMTRAQNLVAIARSAHPFVHVLLKTFYAATSRYSAGTSEGTSDGVQLQNIPKRDKKMMPLRKSVTVRPGYIIAAADSSQIEARVLAYEACHDTLLEHFREGRDPYAEQASKFVDGLTAQEIHDRAKEGEPHCKTLRNIGKLCVLSCGYGVGWNKFASTLKRMGISLASTREAHDTLAKHYHTIYRDSNAPIVKFWGECQAVIQHMEMGGSGTFGGPDGRLFEYGMMTICGMEDVPSIKLPTGFIIRYPHLRCKLNSNTGRQEYFYDRVLGKKLVPTKIYSGLVAENVTQGLAFQILMHQAIDMYKQGVHLSANIHDSFASVCKEEYGEQTLAIMVECLKKTPDFVKGLPLNAEGELGHDFRIV